MRSSESRRQEAGFIATVALLVMACIFLLWAVSCLARHSVETQLLQEQLAVRLQRELPQEVQRLRAQARASGAVLSRQTLEAQAFINLYDRGRRELLALEEQRQHAKELVAARVDAREELRMLGLAVRRGQMWLIMLEARLERLPQVRKVELEGRGGDFAFVLVHA